MPDREHFKTEIHRLIKKYQALDPREKKEMSEANVRKDFINDLFSALGWTINDSNEYDSEYRLGNGFVDIAIKDQSSQPIILVEAKRFNKIAPFKNRIIDTTLKGKPIEADWTSEERQLIRYADGSLEAKFAILTNFEKFRVFNARTSDIIINIENPSEYLEYLDELLFLSSNEIKRGNYKNLLKVKKRSEIDLNFLDLIQKWRLLMARCIIEKTSLPLDEINFIIQRILDRFIIIRYAEDRYIIDGEQLNAIHQVYTSTSYLSLSRMVKEFFDGFDGVHNSKIFEKNELVDNFLEMIDDDVLDIVINGFYTRNFKKLDPHILGNTYETYLGTKLVLRDNNLEIEPVDDSQKEDGIVYTPSHIVRYMGIETLKIKLDSLWYNVKQLFEREKYSEAVMEFNKINEIKVLDPACGSGSFLIVVFDIFYEYYKKYEKEVDCASAQLKKMVETKKIEWYKAAKIETEMINVLKKDYKSIFERKILKNNIYGVDLDRNAAEIASVNLMLKALKPDEKLPLILDENIKVGNSLITGIDDEKELLTHSKQIKELIRYRELIKVASSNEKKELEIKYTDIKNIIDQELNENLYDHFDSLDIIKPFNWEIEFPEIFFDKNGNHLKNGGFDIIIGNPPYKSTSRIPESERGYFNKFYKTIGKEMNYFSLFIEKYMQFLNNEGIFSFIVPDSLLTVTSYQKIREKILESTSIYNITNVPGGAFEDVEVGNSTIIMFKKGSDSINIETFEYVESDDWEIRKIDNINQNRYKQIPENIFYLDNWSIDFTTSRFINGYKPLHTVSYVRDGIKTGNNPKFVSNKKSSEKHEKLLVGTDIFRYAIDYNNLFVLYDRDLLSAPRKEHIFTADEKIITRQTGDRIIAAYDNEKFYSLDNTHLILKKEDNYPIKYILGLVNSKLMDYYYGLLVPEKNRTYAQVRIEKLNLLPILETNPKNQHEIIKKVDDLLILNKIKQKILKSFQHLIINTNQNHMKSLSYYLKAQNAQKYRINLVDTTELIDKSYIGLPKKFNIRKIDQYIVINVLYENGNSEDVIKISFEDKDIQEFFYISLYIQSLKSKRYRKESEILNRVLNDLKIFNINLKSHKKDVENIKLIMKLLVAELSKSFKTDFKDSPITSTSLDQIEGKISLIDNELDEFIFELYEIEDDEKSFIKNN